MATPPTHDDARDIDLRPRRFRLVNESYDASSEVIVVKESGLCYLAAEEPESMGDALADMSWKHAMKDEMKSIIDNKTWEFASLPAGHRAIGLMWVFKVRKDPTTNIVKHKARLIAKGLPRGGLRGSFLSHGKDGDGALIARARCARQVAGAPHGSEVSLLEWRTRG